ncbi:MAG: LysR family transcriptional regulator [Notoacmeibacter sp.]|nr:LysR family transcriptional regulator [Notoacmeibacter sp.]MCC0031643.1 LysR family transcriptional regulator [Brucellaceae bacterium]
MDRLLTMSVFVAVAEEGGFTPAARRLNMSPPTVTRAVSELEGHLGTRLFHRTTRSVELTEVGRTYLEDCRHVLFEIEEAGNRAVGLQGAPRGKVTITSSVLFGRMVMTPILLDLLDRYPEFSVETLYVDRITHLIDEGIDMAIRIADLPDSSLKAARVGHVRKVLCASPGYLDIKGTPATPADLSNHETIAFRHMTPNGEWPFRLNGKVYRHRVRSRLVTNAASTAIAAAVEGRGITRVLSYMVAPELKAGRLLTLLEEFEVAHIPVHVVHKEAGHVSARVRTVFDFLVEQLRREFSASLYLGPKP